MKKNFSVIDEYINKSTWLINENANWNYSWSGLQAHIANQRMKEYALSLLPKEIIKAHVKGDFHIHNLSQMLVPYCLGHNIERLLIQGIKTKSISAKPAKHFSTAVDHVMNFFFVAQLHAAGAQAFSDIDTFLAPFVHYDKLNYREIKQNIQRLIYNLNFDLREAFQTPFTNLTFNLTCPKALKDKHVIIGGESKEKTYGEFNEESKLINKAFAEILFERDSNGAPFTFPIPTLNLNKYFQWTGDAVDEIFKTVATLGSYYFMNYRGTDIDENAVRAMCCRLNLDMRKIKVARGYWNAFAGTGSIGVVSLNLPKLAYLSKNENNFFERLDKLLDLAKNQLVIKRNIIKDSLSKGLLDFLKLYGFNIDYYFSTIGLIGFNEMYQNLFGTNLSDDSSFIIKVLEYINKNIDETNHNSNLLFNLEMTPGEGSSYRLAKMDREKHHNIITSGTKDAPYYSTLIIPAEERIDLLDRIDIEEKILPLFTGGTIFRIYTGETLDPESCKNFIKKLSDKTSIPYFDITATYSVCDCNKRYMNGRVSLCPECGKVPKIFSRVVGYYRSSDKYNLGKAQEARERVLIGRELFTG